MFRLMLWTFHDQLLQIERKEGRRIVLMECFSSKGNEKKSKKNNKENIFDFETQNTCKR